jgi:site-specific recombinase XerD
MYDIQQIGFSKVIAPPPIFDSSAATRARFTAFFHQLGSKHTDRAYMDAAQDFSAWCTSRGVAQAAQVDAECWRGYLANCSQRYAPATVKQRAICLSRLIACGAYGDASPKDSFLGAPLPKVVQSRRASTLSEDSLRRLIHSGTGPSLIALRDRAVVAFLIQCFVPVRVLCRLRVPTYYRNREGVWLQFGEGRGTPYPCPSVLAAYIEAYLNAARVAPKEDTYLFRSIAGASGALTEKPLTQPDVFRIAQKRAKEVGVPERISPRELRAAGLARHLRLGFNLEVARNLAGHGTTRPTVRYAPLGTRRPRNRIAYRLTDLDTLDEWEELGNWRDFDEW